MMNNRYQELEKRRHFEVEGFKNDIKNLRSRLKDVERQLYKVIIFTIIEINGTAPLASWLKCLPVAWETGVPSKVASYQRIKKWYLMPPYLTLGIIRYRSRIKWNNPGKGVAPSSTF